MAWCNRYCGRIIKEFEFHFGWLAFTLHLCFAGGKTSIVKRSMAKTEGLIGYSIAAGLKRVLKEGNSEFLSQRK